MNERIHVRNAADIDAIEKAGLAALLPLATPLGLIEASARRRPDHCALHFWPTSAIPAAMCGSAMRVLPEKFATSGGAIDFDSPCGVGESGIVALRGPHVGPGYSDIARNPGTFERGWLISGDLGHIDAGAGCSSPAAPRTSSSAARTTSTPR